MNFLEELKRRNVFRVGVAYTVVAWVLVQVASIFFPALQLPQWTITLVAGLVILGFPVALLLAWAYQITPGGIRPTSAAESDAAAPRAKDQGVNYAILGLVAIAVTLIIVDRYVMGSGLTRENPAGPESTGGPPVVAATVELPDHGRLAFGSADIGFDNSLITLSPDGKWLVYVARGESDSVLFRRRVDQVSPPEPIVGTEGAIHAFFSPDGKSVGFLTGDRLKRVSLEGEDVQTLASVSNPTRGFWMSDETIYVADNKGYDLLRVPVSGGDFTTVIERSPARISDILPGGELALAEQTDTSISADYARIVVVDLETGKLQPLELSGFDARWVSSGHLLFGRNGTLFAVRFDRESAAVESEPVPVLQEVAMDSLFGQMQVALSRSGVLAYIKGTDRAIGRLVSVNQDGEQNSLQLDPHKFGVVDLSDDDREIAAHIADVQDYVVVHDLERLESRKLPGSEGFGSPRFSPGQTLAYSSVSATPGMRIKSGPNDGSVPSQVDEIPEAQGSVTDWSPTGREVAISDWRNGGIGLVSLGDQGAVRWLSRQRGEWGGVFSPDGRWLAYTSNETGRSEIWVRSIDEQDQVRQLTVNGGIEPVWCSCGKIFYRRGNEIWASTVTLESEPVFGTEVRQFVVDDFLDTPGRSYDVSSDGQTLFTVVRAHPSTDDGIHLLANWLNTLKHKAKASH